MITSLSADFLTTAPTYFDLSYNNLTGVFPSGLNNKATRPVTYLNLQGNPNLVLWPLPSDGLLALASTVPRVYVPSSDGRYECLPLIVPTRSDLTFLVDASFTAYHGCQCRQGFFGRTPPYCDLLPIESFVQPHRFPSIRSSDIVFSVSDETQFSQMLNQFDAAPTIEISLIADNTSTVAVKAAATAATTATISNSNAIIAASRSASATSSDSVSVSVQYLTPTDLAAVSGEVSLTDVGSSGLRLGHQSFVNLPPALHDEWWGDDRFTPGISSYVNVDLSSLRMVATAADATLPAAAVSTFSASSRQYVWSTSAAPKLIHANDPAQPIRRLLIRLHFSSLFNSSSNILLISEGLHADSNPPAASFIGSAVWQGAGGVSDTTPAVVSSAAYQSRYGSALSLLTPPLRHAQVQLLNSSFSYYFTSRDRSGRHFVLTYSYAYECPTGYSVVESEDGYRCGRTCASGFEYDRVKDSCAVKVTTVIAITISIGGAIIILLLGWLLYERRNRQQNLLQVEDECMRPINKSDNSVGHQGSNIQLVAFGSRETRKTATLKVKKSKIMPFMQSGDRAPLPSLPSKSHVASDSATATAAAAANSAATVAAVSSVEVAPAAVSEKAASPLLASTTATAISEKFDRAAKTKRQTTSTARQHSSNGDAHAGSGGPHHFRAAAIHSVRDPAIRYQIYKELALLLGTITLQLISIVSTWLRVAELLGGGGISSLASQTDVAYVSIAIVSVILFTIGSVSDYWAVREAWSDLMTPTHMSAQHRTVRRLRRKVQRTQLAGLGTLLVTLPMTTIGIIALFSVNAAPPVRLFISVISGAVLIGINASNWLNLSEIQQRRQSLIENHGALSFNATSAGPGHQLINATAIEAWRQSNKASSGTDAVDGDESSSSDSETAAADAHNGALNNSAAAKADDGINSLADAEIDNSSSAPDAHPAISVPLSADSSTVMMKSTAAAVESASSSTANCTSVSSSLLSPTRTVAPSPSAPPTSASTDSIASPSAASVDNDNKDDVALSSLATDAPAAAVDALSPPSQQHYLPFNSLTPRCPFPPHPLPPLLPPPLLSTSSPSACLSSVTVAAARAQLPPLISGSERSSSSSHTSEHKTAVTASSFSMNEHDASSRSARAGQQDSIDAAQSNVQLVEVNQHQVQAYATIDIDEHT